MTRKTKTKPKAARARTAPAAEQPTPQSAAPVPAPAIVDPAGMRTPVGWNPRDRNPRPAGPRDRLAVLVRGNTYTFSYSDGPLVLAYGKAVAINQVEFDRLREAVDKIDFQDPGKGTRTVRSIRKFRFETDDGEAIELPPIPDVDAGEYVLSAGDQAQRDRLFQGQEHTAR